MSGNLSRADGARPEADMLVGGLPRLLKPVDVAEVLGVGLRTLELWRQSGDGPPFVKLGPKLIRYREADLATFIAETVRASTSSR